MKLVHESLHQIRMFNLWKTDLLEMPDEGSWVKVVVCVIKQNLGGHSVMGVHELIVVLGAKEVSGAAKDHEGSGNHEMGG